MNEAVEKFLNELNFIFSEEIAGLTKKNLKEFTAEFLEQSMQHFHK